MSAAGRVVFLLKHNQLHSAPNGLLTDTHCVFMSFMSLFCSDNIFVYCYRQILFSNQSNIVRTDMFTDHSSTCSTLMLHYVWVNE